MEALILGSSSAGNCTALRSAAGEPILLLDAGFSKHATFAAMRAHGWAPEDIAAFVVTHEHTDHVFGLEGLAKFMRRSKIVMSAGTAASLKWVNNSFPVETVKSGDDIEVAGFHISACAVSHDAAEPLAFFVTTSKDGQQFAYVMDLGIVTPEIFQLTLGAETVFIEANHQPEMLAVCQYKRDLKQRIAGDTGHLSNHQLAAYLLEAKRGTRRFVIGHLSSKANDPEIVHLMAKGALAHSEASSAEIIIAGGNPQVLPILV